jgi:hypothetical protein
MGRCCQYVVPDDVPDIVPEIVVNIVPDIILNVTPELHDVVTRQPVIVHDILYPILITPFLTGSISGLWLDMISGFLTRYCVRTPDIWPDISNLPFLDGCDIGKSPIS